MELGITNRVALVTGAGGGIGRSIALRLVQEGARVVAASREQAELDSLLTELGAPERHHAVRIDFLEDNAPERLLAEVKRQVPQIDIVVNNVGGTLDVTDPFCSLADWHKVMRLNLEVAVEINRLVLPEMQQRKWGRVVNIASISGAENHGPVPYCSAKAALIAYTRSMGRLVSPDAVIMTAVLPGAVFTEGGYWDTARRERPEHVEKYLQERMAIHRFGAVEEISSVVAFLCSEAASFCVGSIVPVDGGQGRTFFGV